MKLTSFLVGPCLLTLLVGCNDVGSNRRAATASNPERTIPSLESDEVVGVKSQLHRDRGGVVLSYAQEIANTLTNKLPDIYRTVPLMEKDDEGSKANVTTVTERIRPRINCGSTLKASISARIQDCLEKNGDVASWEGKKYGSSGEGNWKLVMKSVEQEIWLDSRTGMLWSGAVKNPTAIIGIYNWCKASGNIQTASTADGTTINCWTLNGNEKVCDQSIVDAGIEVDWRLPTRNDFLQADLNGMRFVLKKDSGQGFWTATMRAASVGRSEAWVYGSEEGTLTPGNLASERQVRCIGVPL